MWPLNWFRDVRTPDGTAGLVHSASTSGEVWYEEHRCPYCPPKDACILPQVTQEVPQQVSQRTFVAVLRRLKTCRSRRRGRPETIGASAGSTSSTSRRREEIANSTARRSSPPSRRRASRSLKEAIKVERRCTWESIREALEEDTEKAFFYTIDD